MSNSTPIGPQEPNQGSNTPQDPAAKIPVEPQVDPQLKEIEELKKKRQDAKGKIGSSAQATVRG